MTSTDSKSKQFKNIILALIGAALGASLFPMIKIGYDVFQINSTSIPDILMFAAFRFVICGIIVCTISLIKKEEIKTPKFESIINIIWLGIFAIVLHYAFTYIGLSLVDSSKTALLKQSGQLLYVCFAFLFIKSEKFSLYKLIGGLIGFGGMIAINASGSNISFSYADIIIISSSVCTVISGIISEKIVKQSSPLWITGISQLSGGIILLVAAITMKGNLLIFTFESSLVFLYICTASVFSYTLFYYVQRTINLSVLYIIQFSTPLFACILSAILLGEDIFKLQYLFAFILITAGIILGNKH